MDFIFPQTTPIFPVPPLWIAMAPVSAVSPARQQDRITRVSTLTPQDMSAGLLRLSMNYPAACDAMLDKVQQTPSTTQIPAGNLNRSAHNAASRGDATIGQIGPSWRRQGPPARAGPVSVRRKRCPPFAGAPDQLVTRHSFRAFGAGGPDRTGGPCVCLHRHRWWRRW